MTLPLPLADNPLTSELSTPQRGAPSSTSPWSPYSASAAMSRCCQGVHKVYRCPPTTGTVGDYRVIAGDRNCSLDLAGFLLCALELTGRVFGSFLRFFRNRKEKNFKN